MSRGIRALGRELRPDGVPGPRSPAGSGLLLRHLPELVAVGLLGYGWHRAAQQVGAGWAAALGAALAVGALCWGPARRCLLALAGCLLTRARLRPALAELRLSSRTGRPPRTIAMVPTRLGERVWLLCPVGVAAEDIADESDRLRAACFAREALVRPSRLAAIVVVDVIRRIRPASPVATEPASHGATPPGARQGREVGGRAGAAARQAGRCGR